MAKTSLKDRRLVPVQQNPVLNVPAYGPRKNNLLEVTAFLHQSVQRVAMGHADDVLLDDRTLVQNFCYVVAGSAHQLHSALKRAMVGLGSDECRQKRVMNIDDTTGKLLDEVIGQNLHVACQDNEINAVLT